MCLEFLCPDEGHRPARGGPGGAFALVVVLHALLQVVGDTDVEGVVGALENVTVEHCEIWCPSTSLGTPHPSPDVVEAGELEYSGVLKMRNLLKNRQAQKSKSAEIAPNWNVSGTRVFLRPRNFSIL